MCKYSRLYIRKNPPSPSEDKDTRYTRVTYSIIYEDIIPVLYSICTRVFITGYTVVLP